MKASEALTVLEQLGSSQWGLATTGQAEALGVLRVDLGRLCDAGSIQRVRRGVYALASATYGPLQSVQAAWLATAPAVDAETRVMEGDDVVVSHVSAAQVHGLGDLVSARHEFTSPRRRQTTQADVRFHRLELPDEDRTVVDGLPATSVLRTVADLATSHADLDHLAGVVRDALSIPGTRRVRLAARLDPVAPRYGYDTGLALVDECLNRAGVPDVAADLLTGFNTADLQNLRSVVQTLQSSTEPAIEGLREVVRRTVNTAAFNPGLTTTLQSIATSLEVLRASNPLLGSPEWTRSLLPDLYPSLYRNIPNPLSSLTVPARPALGSTIGDELEDQGDEHSEDGLEEDEGDSDAQ